MAGGEEASYRAPGETVAFGDIFEADFMLDLFAREDAVFLGGGELSGAPLVAKLGRWMNDTGLGGEAIGLYSEAFAVRSKDRFALAHASSHRLTGRRLAILVSDSCLAATALAQGRRDRSPGGRLLFAPLREVEADEWRRLEEEVDFERLPLAPFDGAEYPVAELRHVFMVDARRLADHLFGRLLSLTDAGATRLEERWSAFATRRGPLAYERNTLKLAYLLAGGEQPGVAEQETADALADVLDVAWQLEGGELEEVSDVEERVRLAGGSAAELTPPLRAAIGARLRELAAMAGEAAERLEAPA